MKKQLTKTLCNIQDYSGGRYIPLLTVETLRINYDASTWDLAFKASMTFDNDSGGRSEVRNLNLNN